MNLLIPSFKLRLLPLMLGISCLGALIAGSYGILHDQITYSISGEYFTRMKFNQFYYANFGWPVRMFVSEIGFLATWWVGFVSGWFLARIAVPSWPAVVAFKRCLAGFCIIFFTTFAAGVIGWFLGVHHTSDYSHWRDMCWGLGVKDVPAFVTVGYIHNAGYIGGLTGLVAALVHLVRLRKIEDAAPGNRGIKP